MSHNKTDMIDRALDMRYNREQGDTSQISWAEIADKLNVSRSTLYQWMKSDDWKIAESARRTRDREEARTDAASLARKALNTINDLMDNARSEYVRFMAAKEAAALARVADELEEKKLDQSVQLNQFLEQLRAREVQKGQALRVLGEGNIIDVQILDGGRLPDSVREADAVIKEAQAQHDLDMLEFEVNDDEPDGDL